MEIKETIVVEGKSDVVKLSSFIKANFIITNGTHISKATIDLIKIAQAKTGVIIFTDPDFPGNQIRQKLNDEIPGCKNAFIMADEAREKAKVGVEHADEEILRKALSNLVSYQVKESRFDQNDLYDLGLLGSEKSNKLRKYVGHKLSIGQCNGKTFLKRLNMIDISRDELNRLVNKGEKDG